MSLPVREKLQMELADVYSELADIAQRQAALTMERLEVEAERDTIRRELGRVAIYDE